MCDCSSLKELFDYSGDIHEICRIAQELLGYNFTFVHCPARMMRDVDSLNRFYDPLIRQYEIGVADRANADRTARPSPYNAANFPAFALKCPDTTHAALHTPTSVTLSEVTPHVQQDQTHHLTTNYPIIWSRMTSTNPSTTLRNASFDLLLQSRQPGWISVRSRSGSLASSFLSLSQEMTTMQSLLVNRHLLIAPFAGLPLPSQPSHAFRCPSSCS